MKDEELKSYLQSQSIQSQIDEITVGLNGLILLISPANLVEVLGFLKDNQQLQFKVLIDIFGSDYPSKHKRFEVIYSLLSLKKNFRMMLKICVAEEESIPSVVSLYESACWYEREIWDMYGINFQDSPDLRRILTDYGFEGHPLRKDFPLTGYVEVRYDSKQEKVIYEPVTLMQDFRQFDFVSPWEGTNYILPGDEKVSK